jgi:hypothetical protein
MFICVVKDGSCHKQTPIAHDVLQAELVHMEVVLAVV